MTAGARDEIATRRLVLCILYKGPWEYLTSWLYKMHRVDDDGNIPSRYEVSDKSLRGRLANWADRRDHAWREKFVQAGTEPKGHWKRLSKD